MQQKKLNFFKIQSPVQAINIIEDDDVPVDPELSIALVDYVKAKFFEKDGDYEKSQFHMRQFKKRVFEFQKNRFGGPKIAMPLASYSIT